MARLIIPIESGTRYGKLKFVEDAGFDTGHRRIGLFVCDCGTEKILRVNSVTSGHVFSCGCMRGKAHGVTEEEKQRMIQMAKSMSPYAIAQVLNRDRTTVRDVVKPKQVKTKESKDGYFNMEDFLNSDFILTA